MSILSELRHIKKWVLYLIHKDAEGGGSDVIPATNDSVPVILSGGSQIQSWVEDPNVPVGSSLLVNVAGGDGQPGLTNVVKTSTEGAYSFTDISGDRISNGPLSSVVADETGTVGVTGLLYNTIDNNPYSTSRASISEIDTNTTLVLSGADNNIFRVTAPITITVNDASGGIDIDGSTFRIVNTTGAPIEITATQANLISLEDKRFIAAYGYVEIVCLGLNESTYDYLLTGDLVDVPTP